MRNERKQRKLTTNRTKSTNKLSSYWHVDKDAYQRLLDDYNDLNQDKKEVTLYY